MTFLVIGKGQTVSHETILIAANVLRNKKKCVFKFDYFSCYDFCTNFLNLGLHKVDTHRVAPERVVDAADEDGQQRERDPEQVVREEALIALLRLAGESMVDRGQDHADLQQDKCFVCMKYSSRLAERVLT